MTDWATTNIQLLNIDRCASILSKALLILDGLTSFNTEIIGMPTWPSVPIKYTALFLLKLYFSNTLIDVTELTNFFSIPSEQIMIIGTKIALNAISDDEATKFLDTLLLSNVDMNDELQNIIIRETLLNFDQIMRITTINLWQYHKEKEKNTTAALNLKSKIMALESIKASELTAMAITRATENIDNNNNLSLSANLRLNNLEKSIRRQEQKINEAINYHKQNNFQKNTDGSYHLEQIASPNRLAPLLNNTSIVDLTQDKMERTSQYGNQDRQFHPVSKTKNQKHQKRSNYGTDPSRKKVHWKQSESKKFNPNTPATSTFQTQDFHTNPIRDNQTTGFIPPYHFTTPQPLIFGTPLDNPFHNGPYTQHQQTQRPTFQHIQTLQGQTQNPYQTRYPYTQNHPFPTMHHHLNQLSGNNPFISQHPHNK
jgi:hypothetical protein